MSANSKQQRKKTSSKVNRLNQVNCWIFDLDNTLYPVTKDLLSEIDAQMSRFVSNFLNIDSHESRKVQKKYFREYGLTLRGLMIHHNLDPDVFFKEMTPTNLEKIQPNPALGEIISTLPGRKLIYTNSAREHAELVLERLGIRSVFEGVFDIKSANYVPKPAEKPYQTMCEQFFIEPRTALMVDDIARNLRPASALGMTTVWMQTTAEWAETSDVEDFIDITINDISTWLSNIQS
ncbi:MAG: pyrimidine 5'-nucleotidase [Pseudomonadota bacterium]|nr:pyrimidine 5'-nucleotidase [Pseudomonadota bacterium]